jgi:hypothetical protein
MNESACSHHVPPAGEDEGSIVDVKEAVQFEHLATGVPCLSQKFAAVRLFEVAELITASMSPFSVGALPQFKPCAL